MASRENLARLALAGKAPQELVDQQGNVLTPRAQRRQLDGDTLRRVEEVLAKIPRADHGGQVPAGGGDHPHVDLLRPATPRRSNVCFLQGAQPA